MNRAQACEQRAAPQQRDDPENGERNGEDQSHANGEFAQQTQQVQPK